MTNQDLINKLNKFPLDKEIVFFCHEDFVGQEFIWNTCIMENIKECLYIEFNDRIFSSMIELENHMMHYYDTIDREFIKNMIVKEVIMIDLNV
jgi:hypothetical protein